MVRRLMARIRQLLQPKPPTDRYPLVQQQDLEDRLIEDARQRIAALTREIDERDPRTHP